MNVSQIGLNLRVRIHAAWMTQELKDTATVALDSAIASLSAFRGAYHDFKDELVTRGIVTDHVAGDVCPDRPTARRAAPPALEEHGTGRPGRALARP